MLDPIFSALAGLLNLFYTLVPYYAIDIGLLTFVVMLALFPLNAKGMRSMAAMAKLSPEMRRIQEKHKNDKVKQNEEVMALFKEHKVTPFGGCLPLILQMPVLFIMYNVIRGLTHLGPDKTFDPKYLDHGSKLYQALDHQRTMKSFGIDLARTASDALKGNFVHALPYLVLIVGVVATGYWQQRMMSRRNPQSGSDDNPMAKQMQQMTKIMPLMYLVFGFTLPAALNVYFLISSLFRIAQQTLIYKMDPSLTPATGARTVASREVSGTGKKSAGGSNAKSTPKPAPKSGSTNGSAKAKAKEPAPTPARVANRPTKKKKRR
jgi:YidC/Oxa1 family membrane protein insertase